MPYVLVNPFATNRALYRSMAPSAFCLIVNSHLHWTVFFLARRDTNSHVLFYPVHLSLVPSMFSPKFSKYFLPNLWYRHRWQRRKTGTKRRRETHKRNFEIGCFVHALTPFRIAIRLLVSSTILSIIWSERWGIITRWWNSGSEDSNWQGSCTLEFGSMYCRVLSYVFSVLVASMSIQFSLALGWVSSSTSHFPVMELMVRKSTCPQYSPFPPEEMACGLWSQKSDNICTPSSWLNNRWKHTLGPSILLPSRFSMIMDKIDTIKHLKRIGICGVCAH